MACASLSALPRACGAEGGIGGLEKLYMIAFSDLSGVTSTYTVSSGGTISAIGIDSGKHFVEVGLLKSTSGIQSALTKDLTKGVAFWTSTLTLVLGGLSIENRAFVESVTNQPVAVIVKSRTGKYFFTGGNSLMELKSADANTGIQEADLNGFTLTFEGVDSNLIRLVDDSIVPSLIA
jgi:hypothetical protein